MVQILRPVADTSDGLWTNESGATVDLFASLDESSASDSDYVRSSVNPLADTVKMKLTSSGVIDPVTNNNHVVQYRYFKQGSGIINLGVRVSNSAGRTFGLFWHDNISTTPTDATVTLTSSNASLITDYNDLYIEFVASLETAPTWEDLGENTIISASGDTEAMRISSLEVYNGRVYLAYGDYDTNKPDGGSKLLYWDIGTEAYVDSGVTLPGYGMDLALIDDELWVLTNDEAVGTHLSYTTIEPDFTTTIRNFGSQIMGYHIFDAYFFNGKPFLCGAHYGSGGDSDGAVWRYDAPNWVLAVSNTTIHATTGYRIYTLLEADGYLWAKSHAATTYRSSDGETWAAFGIAISAQASKGISLASGCALYRTAHWPPSGGNAVFRLKDSQTLLVFAQTLNGKFSRDLYKASDGTPYILDDGGNIWKGNADGALFTRIVTGGPSTASSLCLDDDYYYVGTYDSHLWRVRR